MFARIASFLLIGISAASAADPPPPKVSLTIAEPFNFKASMRQFGKGEDVLVSPPYRMTATAPLTEYSGFYGNPNADQDHRHDWSVAVYRALSQKAVAAYANAKDGYDADLNVCPEFLGCADTSYLFARFARKRFRWGKAVSFLSQSTQDAAMFVPHNGHLQYDVWGVTDDQRFTVVAQISVSHPKLAGWVAEKPKLRSARSLEELKKDKDYKLVERCRPEEFEPSLKAFDRMLDSLVIR